MSAGAEAAALDASVVVDGDRSRRKKVAAVAYYEAELAAAQEAVERLADKAGRLSAQADEANDAYEEAIAGVEAARERYESAKAEVS